MIATRTLSSAALLLFALAGCAHQGRYTRGVPIDSRPTPAQPPASTTTPTAPRNAPATTEQSRDRLRARIVADTTAASAAVRRCSTRTLLPDQESVFDTVRSLLLQTRAALVSGEVERAESSARKARQLAASLSCP